ncbi:hypothetical protein D3C76_944090 [compost metagenome]
MILERQVLGEQWLEARNQPADGGGACPVLARMQIVPAFPAELQEHRHAGLQAGEGFLLLQRPGHPRSHAQILGLGSKNGLADFEDFLPVHQAIAMQGRRLGQLRFQALVFGRIAHILAWVIPGRDGVGSQFEIVRCKFSGMTHPCDRP